MAKKSNLFKMNNTVINIVVLVIVLVLLYLFLGKCRENFTGKIDYIKPSYFKPVGKSVANKYLVVMYYAPWCYYSKVALTSDDGYGSVTETKNYGEVQKELGFDVDREKLGIEHEVDDKTVTMAAINCDAANDVNDSICRGASITAYPTIKVYKLDIGTNAVTEIGEYTGEIKMGNENGNDNNTINKYIKNLS